MHKNWIRFYKLEDLSGKEERFLNAIEEVKKNKYKMTGIDSNGCIFFNHWTVFGTIELFSYRKDFLLDEKAIKEYIRSQESPIIEIEETDQGYKILGWY